MLENAKVGDRVRSVLAGWGTVESIYPNKEVTVKFAGGKNYKTFLSDGKYHFSDIYPEIVEVKRQEWEPESGQFIIDDAGEINDLMDSDIFGQFKCEGRVYPTKEKAEKAYTMIRPYQRLVAYVLEHAPEWEPDWEDHLEEKWYVKYDNWAKKYVAEYNEIFQHLCQVYMPKEVAIDLAEKLNSGEVRL